MDEIELDKIKKEEFENGQKAGVETALNWAIKEIEIKINNKGDSSELFCVDLCKQFKSKLDSLKQSISS